MAGGDHRVLGEHDIDMVRPKRNLAQVYIDQGRFSEAEVELKEGYTLMATAEFPIGVATQIDLLVNLYDAWGRPEQAAEWRVKLPTAEEALATDQDPTNPH